MADPVTYRFEDEASLPSGMQVPAEKESASARVGKGIAKAAGQSALPVAAGMAAGAIPGVGPFVAPIAAAGGEYLNQKLGITEPSTAGIISSGISEGMGRVGAAGLAKTLERRPPTRELTEQMAREGIAKMLPKEAAEAQAWKNSVSASGKTMPYTVDRSLKPGDKGFSPLTIADIETSHLTFDEAMTKLDKLRKDVDVSLGKSPEDINAAKKNLNQFEEGMSQAFPGYKKYKGALARINAQRDLESTLLTNTPLDNFNELLKKGQMSGTEGSLLDKTAMEKAMQPHEIADAQMILRKLGNKPGENIFQGLVKGRAIGHVLGMMSTGVLGAGVGYAGSGGNWQSAATGALAGLFLPKAIDAAITVMLKNEMGRSMLRHAIQGEQITNPVFWSSTFQILKQAGFDVLGQASASALAQQEMEKAMQQAQQQQQQQPPQEEQK